MKEAGAQNTKAIKNPKAMNNIARWQQAMKDMSESPFAKDVSISSFRGSQHLEFPASAIASDCNELPVLAAAAAQVPSAPSVIALTGRVGSPV